jgi:DNA-binding NtrC family response regulator
MDRLAIPSIVERLEEIPSLVEVFLTEANKANGFAMQGIGPEALELLRRHSWPGNVRELSNVIHRAVVLALGDTIDDLPTTICRRRSVKLPHGLGMTHGRHNDSVSWEGFLSIIHTGRSVSSRSRGSQTLAKDTTI